MALVDYHIHTPLCGHATGLPGEFVSRAIREGLDEIGFSDHAPLPMPLRQGVTMAPEDVEGYLQTVLSLKREFAGRIIIRAGFEVDFPLHPTFDTSLAGDPRVDYLIGSCHFLDTWPLDHPDFVDEFSRRDIDDIYRQYYKVLGDLALSGMFQILGHLDLVKKFGHRSISDLTGEVETLAKKLYRSAIAVEINTAGLVKPVGEIYPSPGIVKILFEHDIPVTLGSDAHSPDLVAGGFDRAVELIRAAGYRRICGFERRKRYDIPL